MQIARDAFIARLNSVPVWSPMFKVTNVCNLKCAHCCERSGPDAPRVYMPISDINTILADFKPYFRATRAFGSVTGGEPMTAYNEYYANYIPRIITTFAKNGYALEFKTNAAWTLGDKASQIFGDIETIMKKYPNMCLLWHVSLDKYHANCADAVSEFLNWFTSVRNAKNMDKVHIFYDDPHRLSTMMTELKLKYDKGVDFDADTSFFAEHGLNALKFDNCEKYIIMDKASVNSMGRAADNNIPGRHIDLVQTIINHNNDCFVPIFDQNGNVGIFGCGDMDVRIPYRDARGNIKSLPQLKRELFTKTWDIFSREMIQRQY